MWPCRGSGWSTWCRVWCFSTDSLGSEVLHLFPRISSACPRASRKWPRIVCSEVKSKILAYTILCRILYMCQGRGAIEMAWMNEWMNECVPRAWKCWGAGNSLGAVHKVCHAWGGGVQEGVTVCDRRRGFKRLWCHTYKFFYHTYKTWNFRWFLTFCCDRCILTEGGMDKIHPGQNFPD